jgi:hypothetical protein
MGYAALIGLEAATAESGRSMTNLAPPDGRLETSMEPACS